MKCLPIAFIIATLLTSCNSAKDDISTPLNIPDLICFWDFQEITNGGYAAKGTHNYLLIPKNGPINREKEGIFGEHSLNIKRGQWLRIKRKECPALNLYDKDQVSIVAWIKRRSEAPWQYIAGMWNERDAKRQYALFTCGTKMTDHTNLERVDARYQTHGYVSEVGGKTKGKSACFSYATGKSKIALDTWVMIAFTFDQHTLKVYFNGKFDQNGNYNPFKWNKPIFDGKENGSDFTVAQRALPKWPGYPDVEEPTHKEGFGGVLGGLAVYKRALNASEIKDLYVATMGNSKPEKKDVEPNASSDPVR